MKKLKILLVADGLLGVADFFMYFANDFILHNSRVESAAILISLAIGVTAVFSLLYIASQEQKKQEEQARRQTPDAEARKAVLDLLDGEEAGRGQNLPTRLKGV